MKIISNQSMEVSFRTCTPNITHSDIKKPFPSLLELIEHQIVTYSSQ